MDRFLIPLTVLLCAILQTTVVPAVAAAGAAPDLVFLLVVFFSLQRRTTLGLWTAFWAGMLQDAGGGGPLGLNASILLGISYLVGLLRTKLFKENLSAQVAITVLLTFIHQFLMFYWMNTILDAEYSLGAWTGRALIMSLYHAVLGPLLYKGLGNWIRGEDVYQNLIGGRNLESHFRLKHLG